jgi:hypothetical protein
MSRVCAFLGVDGEHFRAAALSREINRSGIPRMEVLTRALHPPRRLGAPLARIAPPAVRTLVRKARAASLDGARRMPDEARLWLTERLSGVAPAVQKLTGLGTDHWQTDAG